MNDEYHPKAKKQILTGTRVIWVILFLILLGLIVPPIFILIQNSFYTTNFDGSLGKPTVDYYSSFLSTKGNLSSLWNTAVFSIGSALLALLLGGTQAWIVERTNTPFKTLSYLGAIISLGIPYVLYTIAWLLILGNTGPVNTFLRNLLSSEEPVFSVYSMAGMILIEGFLWAPLVFLMMSSTFRSVDASFEEAARMSGARLLPTIYHISFKLALPAVLAVILLVFIRAFEAFEIPALVGLPGEVNVLTTKIFLSITAKFPPEYGFASAYSVILMLLVILLLYLYNRILKSGEKFQTITGKGYRPSMIDLGKWRYLTGTIIILYFSLIIIVPFLMLIWTAMLPFYQPPSWEALKQLTFKNFVIAVTYPDYLSIAKNTIVIGVLSATIVMFFTSLCAWFAARRKPGGWVLDQLATLSLIFPGIVLGVAIMRTYVVIPLPIYGTIWIIVLAFVTKYLPYGMRYNYNGILQIHRELEESAAVSGGNTLTILGRIIFPLLKPAFLTGWLFVFLVSVRELSMALLLSSSSSRVVAVTLYDLWENGQVNELSAFGLVWTLGMVIVASVSFAFANKFKINLR